MTGIEVDSRCGNSLVETVGCHVLNFERLEF